MEVKINREIRNFTESLFFGLDLRQCVCAVLAMAAGIGLYFAMRPGLGAEAVSWACVLGASPFAVLGFFRYNGMTAERFLVAWMRSLVIGRRPLVFRPVNRWVLLTEPITERYRKEGYVEHDKNLKQCA